MKVTKAVLKGIITKVTHSANNSAQSRLQLARDLHWARNVINWGLTDYNNWTGFITVELSMLSYPTIYNYIATINYIEKFNYTDSECKKILAVVGWSAFQNGLIDLNRRITVKAFISKYLRYFTGSKKQKQCQGGDRAYAFSLPKEQADQYDLVLEMYGMSQKDRNRRRGVRSAMIELVNQKLK